MFVPRRPRPAPGLAGGIDLTLLLGGCQQPAASNAPDAGDARLQASGSLVLPLVIADQLLGPAPQAGVLPETHPCFPEPPRD